MYLSADSVKKVKKHSEINQYALWALFLSRTGVSLYQTCVSVRRGLRCTFYHSLMYVRHPAVRSIQFYHTAKLSLYILFFFSIRRASRCTFHSVLSYGGYPAVHSILFQCTLCVKLYVPFSFIVWRASHCTLYSFLVYVVRYAVRSIPFYRMAGIPLYTLFFFSVRLRPRMYA